MAEPGRLKIGSARMTGLSAVARALIQRNSAPDAQSISTEDGLAAAQVAELAARQGIACALAGGIAMHLYGVTRATNDVDVIATRALDLTAVRTLSFGGASYAISVGQRTINVNGIVRADVPKTSATKAARKQKRPESFSPATGELI